MSKKNGSLTLRASRAPDGRASIEAVIGDNVMARDVIDLWAMLIVIGWPMRSMRRCLRWSC